jgi:polysaccharide biosynthesis protein PslF
MHVALLTGEYPPLPGGVGDYTRCLARALVARGVRVTVLTGAGPGDGADTPHEGLTVLRLVRGWDWRCWRDTIAALDQQRPDIVHIQYQTGAYGMHPAVNLLPARLQSLPGRPRVVVTFHDLLVPYLFPKAAPLRRWITTRLARDADRCIATNPDDAERLGALCPALIPIGSNIAVAPPPGYDRAAWRAALGLGPDDFLIAYFGLLSQSKGVDTLLDALVPLRTAARRFHLLLIGGESTAPHDRAYAAQIAPQMERLALHHAITRTGHVDEATVSAHLLAADCVALPFREGASFRSGSLLAALRHGAAIVTTRGGAALPQRVLPAMQLALELELEDGQHALLVPPADSRALADALMRLADDVALRQRLGQGAAALGAAFGWDTIAQAHERVYERA